MGYPFHLKIYNHSDAEIEFTISNDACMHLPHNKTVSAKPKSWAVVTDVSTSSSVWNFCAVTRSKFTISAKRNGKLVGNTTYAVYSTNRRFFFASLPMFTGGGMSWSENGHECDTLIMERVESYGDAFYNGRGLYFEDNIKNLCQANSLGRGQGPVDELLPTALVNSNRQFLQETNDNSISTVIGRAVNLGLSVAEIYGFASARHKGPETPPEVRALEWKNFQEMFKEYYNLYRNSIAQSDQISVVVFKIDHAATFHLLFSDDNEQTADIMLGNFDMPPPPTDGNTFYSNILKLPKSA